MRSSSGTPTPSADFYLLINQGGGLQAEMDAAAAWLDELINTGPSECLACAADFDDNGGVDGGELGAFFALFENGGC